jgi:hypothetical protein
VEHNAASIEMRQMLNADRRRAFGSDPSRVLALVCECGEANCVRTVLMTQAEYDAQPGVILHPDHGEADEPRLH